MTKTTCSKCRHGSMKHRKVKKGVNREGKPMYRMLRSFHCSFQKTRHATDQTNCDDYLGHQTMFEYLMHKQPDVVNELLTRMRLRVVGSRNKWGFDLK
jgi:hypothetical protein